MSSKTINLVGAAALGATLSSMVALTVRGAQVVPDLLLTQQPYQFWLAVLGQGAGVGIVFVVMSLATEHITAPEIGIFCLLEVALGPLFVYFAYGDVPTKWTLIRGSMLLEVLAVHESLPLCWSGPTTRSERIGTWKHSGGAVSIGSAFVRPIFRLRERLPLENVHGRRHRRCDGRNDLPPRQLRHADRRLQRVVVRFLDVHHRREGRPRRCVSVPGKRNVELTLSSARLFFFLLRWSRKQRRCVQPSVQSHVEFRGGGDLPHPSHRLQGGEYRCLRARRIGFLGASRRSSRYERSPRRPGE
jgi:hypothetical protein